MTGRFVVAGNGPSIAQFPTGVLRPDDFIIRVNSFFFEPVFYLGQRVDLAFIGGDPLVAPLVFETLYHCQDHYDLSGWSTHNPKVLPHGQRRFGGLYQEMRFRDAALKAQVETLVRSYQKHPTTGTYAVLMAHGLGAEEILLTGFDFYQKANRYCYPPGASIRALMGQDIATRGLDQRLHDVQLDLDILRLLQDRDHVRLLSATDVPVLRNISQLVVPNRAERRTSGQPKRSAPPMDWVARSGLTHVRTLKLRRQAGQLFRRIRRIAGAS